MKKILAIALGLTMAVGVFGSAYAQGAGPKNGAPQGAPGGKQGQGHGRMMAGRRMQEEIFAKLNLTDKQKTAIKAINDKYKKEFEALRPKLQIGTPPAGGNGQGKGGERRAPLSDAQRQKLMDLIKKRNAEIRGVLSPSQQAEYDKLMKEAMAKFQKRGGRPGGAPPPGGKTGGGKSGGGN